MSQMKCESISLASTSTERLTVNQHRWLAATFSVVRRLVIARMNSIIYFNRLKSTFVDFSANPHTLFFLMRNIPFWIKNGHFQ